MKITRMSTLSALSAALAFGAVAPSMATDDRDERFGAKLSGYNEVHFIVNPAALRGGVSTAAKGRFNAENNEGARLIHYELSYGGLEGTVMQAHIHFGQHHSVGGIVV